MQLHRDTSPASTTEIYRKLVTNPYGVPCTCITESAWKFVHSLKHHFFHSPLSLIGRQVWNLPFLHSRRASYCLNRQKVQVRKLAALVEECPKKTHACLQQHKHKHTKKRKPYICFQQETSVYARKEPCREGLSRGHKLTLLLEKLPGSHIWQCNVQSLREMPCLSFTGNKSSSRTMQVRILDSCNGHVWLCICWSLK